MAESWHNINISTDRENWQTPKDLFDRLDQIFHFTLDPCSTDENALCEHHYTEQDDGLKQNWTGTVFMNPPYNKKTGKWVKKAFEESKKGATVVCLIPARPDSYYWHDYIFPYAEKIWFIRQRITFQNASDHAPFPSAIVVFSDKKGKYADLAIELQENERGIICK